MRKKKIRNLAAVVGAAGLLLSMVELDGGPCVFTIVGAALILAALAAMRINNFGRRKAENENHVRVYRRPAGRNDAA